MQKLPKQWKHWCRKNGLKIRHFRRCYRVNAFYPHGHGHHWRLNCHEMFELGDSFEDFDRWALCDIVSVPKPSSLAEFTNAVTYLLEQKGLTRKNKR